MATAEAGRLRRRRTALAWHRPGVPSERPVLSSVLAAVAGIVALWPYTSVIRPGSWSIAAVTVIVSVAVAGMIVRTLMRRRVSWVRDLVALAVQAAVAIGSVTLIVAGDTAFFGLLPTGETLSVFGTLAGAAGQEIAFGAAPLAATSAMEAVMAAGFAVVAVLLDQFVAQRSAIIAILLAAVVGAMPMIVTLRGADVVWFVMIGILALVLLRFTAAQDAQSPRRTSGAVTAGVGAAALVASIIVAPALPVSATLAGTGAGVTVDASLRLGDDLRQPNPVEVLTLATTAETAPYLRLTTLSEFDGRVWEPDRGRLRPQSEGFGPDEWASDIEATEQSTSIRVIRMSSSWLPVPYPATSLQGVSAAWRVSPDNRTLASRNADAVGNDYTVRSAVVAPTLEQIRATDAAAPVSELVDLPAVIGATAREVTADAENDYDRLIALQSWFRGEFEYSLETPVEEDFDGTGADAVARFLEVRSGYCIHFAGAFSLMAESLGMQVRIVVGYLPGVPTTTTRGDETVFSVSSDQLHSWPEVLFPGVGWVPFEPTASLGVPTAFAAATTTGGGTEGPDEPAPTAAPTSEATSGPEVDRGDTDESAGSSGELRTLDPTPVLLVALGILAVLLLPAGARTVLRAARRSRARRGDAASAWTELRATMMDLGLPLSDAESPRMRGADLVRERGVDADRMRVLTDAVERASYARPSGEASVALDAALADVLAQIRRSADRPSRVRAFIVPRSLFAGRAAESPLLA